MESDGERVRKRQKCSDRNSDNVASGLPATSMTTDAPLAMKSTLKGRRRYNADIADMEKHRNNFRRGDEDSTFECRIVGSDQRVMAALNFFISDTSDYPENHTFFCHSSDENVPDVVAQAIEALHEEQSRAIEDMLERLLTVLAKKLAGDVDTDEEMEEDDFDYDGHSDDGLDLDIVDKEKIDYRLLQTHFNEVVAYGYRPGFIPFGVDDFVLSVSIPIIRLARDIPARALMAWDRRLLSRTQHLTLLVTGLRGTYPVLQADGTVRSDAAMRGISPQFRIGLTPIYKPQKEHVAAVVRVFGLKEQPSDAPPAKELFDEPLSDDEGDIALPSDEEPAVEESTFQPFSLSASLETLLNQRFLRVVQLRLEHELGWAGAEILAWEAEKLQKKPVDILKSMRKQIRQADEKEAELASSYNLPPDPLLGNERSAPLNLPLLAFCYLLRRLTLCPRYCVVCHEELKTGYESLKPYVCDTGLCTYQYYNLNLGPTLEYEICENTDIVDLLVSITYIAAKESSTEGPFPIGMGLRVPHMPGVTVPMDEEKLCDFDQLTPLQMCKSVVELFKSLPSIASMKKHLEKPVVIGRSKPKLRDVAPTVPIAAWLLLRWCVGSCMAHLEELRSQEDRITNIDPSWRQFRFSVGAPDAEAKFQSALAEVQQTDANSVKYPSLYAFHGSPLKNWHSIIRHGLWFKTVAHGRAYGDGVYFAKDGTVSQGYSARAQTGWKSSSLNIQSCVALAQIVNMPSRFVSTNPYLVVANTNWIICRYLLVHSANPDAAAEERSTELSIPYVELDPANRLTMATREVQVPEPSYRLEKLLSARRDEYLEVDYDADDMTVFKNGETISQSPTNALQGATDESDWVHDPVWVNASIENVLPPPSESSLQATMAVQRELKAMLKEQEQAKTMRELGWHLPTEFIGDNLYQWIDLAIAKDMEARNVTSLVFEIRFPHTFPHSPPFFRILKPRLLPFILASEGGGGHVTGDSLLGGSMCMDLLTADGWLPSYSISAILLQIKLAISNVEPRPARLAQNWDVPYGMQEALDGYKRAANTHGWTIPRGLEKLAR
ncbi:uncharacterized protein B0H18DRAFT_1084285 [Fomitopsis serialis]|uniref:uncharacterized protein n=1 Tax=Fomitopsis serialis TaxID=139415 RepID=UPI0020078D7D|nr:uncharacterized protein B0H18DRAFT_1084285 [Neoantrodia serialis]KAH9929262.1 hypothetical protein B0H18DRAFT_1084285 [Neoantrodia serialis]